MNTFQRICSFFLAATIATLLGCAGGENRQSTGEYIDDAAITAKVKAALIDDDSLDANDINVETYKGKVQLSGFVDSRDEVRQAEEVASGVNGVTDVENDLRVKSDD